jgi:hypothetical protein
MKRSNTLFRRRRHHRNIQTATIGIVLACMLMALPVSSLPPSLERPVNSQISEQVVDSQRMFCQIEGNKIIKELPITDVQRISELCNASMQDFLVILNKTMPQEDVDRAFNNLQPFFEALHHYGLTSLTADDFDGLYHDIRSRIKTPHRTTDRTSGGRMQTLGLWNGAPVPAQLNIACGTLAAGGAAAGWVAGTHTLLPTLGADLFLASAFDGTCITLGVTGATLQNLAQFIVIFGFAGILLGCLPSGLIAGLIFMAGFSLVYLGIGPPV